MPPPQTADLRWFELDQPDVIAAKQQLLRELLAEVPGAAGASQGSGSSLDDLPAEPGSPVESGLSRHLRWECASACAVVLAAESEAAGVAQGSSLAGLPAELQSPG